MLYLFALISHQLNDFPIFISFQLIQYKHQRYIKNMDSPPPNNNNPDRNNNAAARAKDDALRPRTNGENENGEVDMINLQDNGLVVVMFLMSVAGWMLRERCVC